ncbi:MAG: hypothetical protein SFU98_06650 [Leptospiraceae bacterium]|nr:hypothetical protein [Leptospiraceae bacterium]
METLVEMGLNSANYMKAGLCNLHASDEFDAGYDVSATFSVNTSYITSFTYQNGLIPNGANLYRNGRILSY